MFQNTKKIYFRFTHASSEVHFCSTKPNILLVNYDSWWQHQMSVRELRHDRPSGRFSKSRGISASISFLSSPPPPSSFTGAIVHSVLDSRSSFFAPRLIIRIVNWAIRLSYKLSYGWVPFAKTKKMLFKKGSVGLPNCPRLVNFSNSLHFDHWKVLPLTYIAIDLHFFQWPQHLHGREGWLAL